MKSLFTGLIFGAGILFISFKRTMGGGPPPIKYVNSNSAYVMQSHPVGHKSKSSQTPTLTKWIPGEFHSDLSQTLETQTLAQKFPTLQLEDASTFRMHPLQPYPQQSLALHKLDLQITHNQKLLETYTRQFYVLVNRFEGKDLSYAQQQLLLSYRTLIQVTRETLFIETNLHKQKLVKLHRTHQRDLRAAQGPLR